MSMDECIHYVEAVVVVGIVLYVGAVILDQISAGSLINTTGPFAGTVTNVANMWSSTTGMIGTVIIIGAAAIIIKMVMGFRKGGEA
ncbi:hypothetical protein [Methanosarcina mazei]|uniref:Uncharacterized protein n=1 Tax=Methanosarcina mazei WWM610 TaxID=1434117 RepID=A0A0E3PWG0_METMZ|nr:hypothetical protein [Methanosarcina mazei]AKB40870.1 hypothetical protein MSMAW_1879 [Methanosarcina mazei WWM610]